MLADAGVHISDFRLLTGDGRELLDVFGGFFLENFHGIVVSQNAEEMVEFIDDGEHDEVVFREHARGLLLVGARQHIFAGLLHDVVHRRVPRRKRQIAQAHFTDEAPFGIDHENPRQGLGVLAVAFEHLDRLLHRHVGGDAPDVGRHPPACGVLLVFEQVARQLLVARAEQAEEAHLCFLAADLENIDAVVVRKIG